MRSMPVIEEVVGEEQFKVVGYYTLNIDERNLNEKELFPILLWDDLKYLSAVDPCGVVNEAFETIKPVYVKFIRIKKGYNLLTWAIKIEQDDYGIWDYYGWEKVEDI